MGFFLLKIHKIDVGYSFAPDPIRGVNSTPQIHSWFLGPLHGRRGGNEGRTRGTGREGKGTEGPKGDGIGGVGDREAGKG